MVSLLFFDDIRRLDYFSLSLCPSLSVHIECRALHVIKFRNDEVFPCALLASHTQTHRHRHIHGELESDKE